MPESEWEDVKELRDLLLSGITNSEEIEGDFNVIADKCVQAIESANQTQLIEGYNVLSRTYSILSARFHDITEKEESFFLGRIVSLLDTMSAALVRIGPPLFDKLLHDKEYLAILYFLHSGEVIKSDLAYRLNREDDVISEQIKKLEETRLIITKEIGNELYLRFSLAGQQAFDELLKNNDINDVIDIDLYYNVSVEETIEFIKKVKNMEEALHIQATK